MLGGITGSGADFITSYMLALGKDLFGSVVITVFTSNLGDKVVTAVLAWAIVKALPLRTTGRLPQASERLGRWLMLVAGAAIALVRLIWSSMLKLETDLATYRYPGSKNAALHQVSLTIPGRIRGRP